MHKRTTPRWQPTRAAHAALRRTIGRYAYAALLKGRCLQVWRNSSPHNQWVADARGYSFLWHSSEDERVDMRLFRLKRHSRERVIQYWGTDSGMPRHSWYLLRKRCALKP